MNGVRVNEHYRWEAERSNGATFARGGDLTGVVRFSLIPCVDGLPRRDFAGAQLNQVVRRFGRGFVAVGGPAAQEYLHCIVRKNARLYIYSSNGSVQTTAANYELYL